jgi:hypothetical protein
MESPEQRGNINSASGDHCRPVNLTSRLASEPSGPEYSARLRTGYSSNQKNVVQRLLMQATNDRNISTIPQPRKPSQTIIAEAITVASKPITTFLLIGLDEDRALILAPRMSTGWRLFIRLSLISERSISATNDVGNLMDELT